MPIVEDFLVNLAAGFTQTLPTALGKRVLGDPQQRALKRAYQAGFEAMLRTAGSGLSEAELAVVGQVIGRFLSQPPVSSALLDLALTGAPLDVPSLATHWEAAHAPADLVNIRFDFGWGLLAFQQSLTAALITEASRADSPLANQVVVTRLMALQGQVGQILDLLQAGPPAAPPAGAPTPTAPAPTGPTEPPPAAPPPAVPATLTADSQPSAADAQPAAAALYHSCFISYASKDQAFADRLYADLRAAGVVCWYAPEDMAIGDRIRKTIYAAIGRLDKLLIILSRNSIASEWVEGEVERAFERERWQKETILFPIRLDDDVMDTDEAWAGDIRRTRHIGDFTRWNEAEAYDHALRRLLRDLEVSRGKLPTLSRPAPDAVQIEHPRPDVAQPLTSKEHTTTNLSDHGKHGVPLISNGLDSQEHSLFCGRINEIGVFQDALRRGGASPNLICVHGIGGIGKSTLLRAYRRYAYSKGVPIALVDGSAAQSFLDVLTHIVSQLEECGIGASYFSRFTECVLRLQALEFRLRSQIAGVAARRDTVTTQFPPLPSVISTIAPDSLPAILEGSLPPELAIPTITASGIERGKRTGANDIEHEELLAVDRKLLIETEDFLTRTFTEALNSISMHKRPIVIMLDAFEYLRSLEAWLQDKFVAGLAEGRFVIVLAGRYPMARDKWLRWTENLVEVELVPFNRDEAKEYLVRRGLTDDTVIDAIYGRSLGLPFALALWTSVMHPSGLTSALPVDSQETTQAQVVSIVVDSLLRDLDQDQREAVWAASTPRWFDSELLADLLHRPDAEKQFDQLRKLQPLVHVIPNGLALHDLARDYLQESLRMRKPRLYRALHHLAAEHFRDRQEQLEARGHAYGEQWQQVSLERIHHCLVLGMPEVFTSEIDRSSRYYQHIYARRLLADVESYYDKVEGIFDIFAYHRAQNLIHHNDFKAAIALLANVRQQLKSPGSDFDGLMTYQMGKAEFWLGSLEQAEEHIEAARKVFNASRNLRMEGHATAYLAKVHEARGDLRLASEEWTRVADIIKEILRSGGTLDLEDRSASDRAFALGEALRLQFDYGRAVRTHRGCLAARMKLRNNFDVGESYIALARCYLGDGDIRSAGHELDSAKAIFSSTGDGYMLADICLLQGRLFDLRAENAHARKSFEEAVTLARASQHNRCLAEALLAVLGISQTQSLASDQHEDVSHLEELLDEVLTAFHFPGIQAQRSALRGRVLLAENRLVEAAGHYSTAIRMSLSFNSWMMDTIIKELLVRAESDQSRLQTLFSILMHELQADPGFAASEQPLRVRDANPKPLGIVNQLCLWLDNPDRHPNTDS